MGRKIIYNGIYLGDIHHLLYEGHGHLPGYKGDLYLHLQNSSSLEQILGLQDGQELEIDNEKMNAEKFRNEIWKKVRDVHFIDNANNPVEAAKNN